MAYVLEPSERIGKEVRRVARDQLDNALRRLDLPRDATADEIEEAVHQVRKRCKESRAVARLVRPSLGAEFGEFNALVRDAAAELSSIRDAHAVLATFDDLRAVQRGGAEGELDGIRDHQAHLADEATRTVQGGDPRIRRARDGIAEARRRVRTWKLRNDFDTLADGLEVTYRRGRKAMRRAERRPTDEHLHEWRKAVKNLWYQVRLVARAAPSVLDPLTAVLDDLADALGDDHDLAVLIERFDDDPAAYGSDEAVRIARRMARDQQDDLRARAIRLGASVYAERPDAFVGRLRRYWELTAERGPERPTGGLAELIATDTDDDLPAVRVVERERKWLVRKVPSLTNASTTIRQGYIALDRSVSVRVRDTGPGGCTLTIKGGSGAVRTEVETPIDRSEFEALWDYTEGRRVIKTRWTVPHGDHTVLVDVFADELDGLVVAEVEFESDASMTGFDPPRWFGDDVTDDPRYSNASLAVRGLGDEPT